MEFELTPAVSLYTGTFNALIAPEELVLTAITSPKNSKYSLLYLAGPVSGILPALVRPPGTMEIRRVVSPLHLAREIRAAQHTTVFIEHDPSLYDNDEDTVPPARAMAEGAGGTVMVIYTPKNDTRFDLVLPYADRVYFFRKPPVPDRRPVDRKRTCRNERGRGQCTLGGFDAGGA